MIKFLTLPIWIFVLTVLSGPVFSSSLKEKAANKLALKYENHLIEYQTQKLPAAQVQWQKKSGQRFFRPQLYRWNITKNDSLIAVAFVDNVMGKEQPITFLIIFSASGKIIQSEILKYRESIGGAVSSPRWLSQFKGKDSESGFALNKDIDGISGATISSESLARGMKKLSYLATFVLKEYKGI